MAVSREARLPKLVVTMKGSEDKSLGTRTISDCSSGATLDGFYKAGNAVMTLCGAIAGEIKKVNTYVLLNE